MGVVIRWVCYGGVLMILCAQFHAQFFGVFGRIWINYKFRITYTKIPETRTNTGFRGWLGWLESNQHGQSQSLLSYR